MTARDELARIIASNHTAGAVEAIIGAGWRKDQYLDDALLYAKDGERCLPDDTFVESADGSVWRMEPDFGWDCVSSGSATLSGPARLLVIGGQE